MTPVLSPSRTGLHIVRFAAACLVAAILATVVSLPAPAQIDGVWPVKGKLVGKKGKRSEDISGIACTTTQGFPRSCLVIDDNLQEAQFVTVEDGRLRAGGTIRLIDNTFRGRPLELDGEGVAFSDGFYYVIGSHGHPRDRNRRLDPERDAALIKARIDAASQVVRFRAGANGATGPIERTSKLRDVIAAEPLLRPFMDRRLEDNGLTIEGLAIRDGRLMAGFRGPVLDDGVAILSVSLAALFGSGEPNAQLHRLRLGTGQGVRALATYRDGVLVLAGPTAEGPEPYAIYWWGGTGEKVRLLKDLSDTPAAQSGNKPEAILPLDRSESGLRVLVLSDGAKEGGPVAVNVPEP